MPSVWACAGLGPCVIDEQFNGIVKVPKLTVLVAAVASADPVGGICMDHSTYVF